MGSVKHQGPIVAQYGFANNLAGVLQSSKAWPDTIPFTLRCMLHGRILAWLVSVEMQRQFDLRLFIHELVPFIHELAPDLTLDREARIHDQVQCAKEMFDVIDATEEQQWKRW